MTIARSGYTATLLPSGKVLIAGGNSATAELYDPATGTFTRTGDMTTPRSNHSATLLPDGKVLIAGGSSLSLSSTDPSSTELYDPSTGTFSSTGDMLQAGAGAAILLANGTVLIAHDTGIGEIYDPVAGTFSATGYELAYFGGRQQGALLADGRALLLLCCRAQQLYDPASGTFSLTGIMTGIYEDGFASALPPAGKVLVTGGYDEEGPPFVSAGACLYDSATGTFAATGNMETAAILPHCHDARRRNRADRRGLRGPDFCVCHCQRGGIRSRRRHICPDRRYDESPGQPHRHLAPGWHGVDRRRWHDSSGDLSSCPAGARTSVVLPWGRCARAGRHLGRRDGTSSIGQ